MLHVYHMQSAMQRIFCGIAALLFSQLSFTQEVNLTGAVNPSTSSAHTTHISSPLSADKQVHFRNSVINARPITGKITGEKGEALGGVSVVVKGTNRGTSTSNDGS